MRTLAIILMLATPCVAGNPCHSAFCVKRAVVVQQHHAYNAYNALYSVPYNSQSSGQFWDDGDKLTLAIETAIDRSLEKRGIGSPLLAQAGASVIATKCAKCHQTGASNADAKAAWTFEATPLSLKDAARAQYGLVHADMATKAKLTDAEQKAIVEELTSYFTSAAEAAGE